MIAVGDSWPVRIGAVGEIGVSPGTVVWRVQGADEIRVTVIVKATLTIVPEGEMTPRDPDGLVMQESHHHADSGCSLRAASDLAPYLGQGEVLVVGHTYAPPGLHTTMAGARVVVHRGGQILVSKTISVEGDRRREADGRISAPGPYQRMPLIYERAILHPELNPIGVDPGRGSPNLIHSADPSRPGCFGPIARRWPARRRLLGALDPRQVEGVRPEFPQGFAWEYFQVSPPDQRLDFLQGTEGILLGGMHPTLPMVRSRLPGIRAGACVYPDRDEPGERLPLWADTMLIDTDRQTCSLVWRGNFGVTDEAALRSARIRAGVELPGRPLRFPNEAGLRSYAEIPADIVPAAGAVAAAAPEAEPDEEVIEELSTGAIELVEDDAAPLEQAAPPQTAPPQPVPLPLEEEEDEDLIATHAVGFLSPIADMELPAAPAPAPPAEPPAPAPPAPEPAGDDEDAIITPRSTRSSGV